MKILIVFCFLSSSVVLAGNEVGNGGDHLHILFAEAKPLAIRQLQSITATAGSDAASAEGADAWLAAHAAELAKDLDQSRLVWDPKNGHLCTLNQCACTDAAPAAAIRLDESACSFDYLDAHYAARILIGAAVRHLGITDEARVRAIVLAVPTAGDGPMLRLPAGEAVTVESVPKTPAPVTSEDEEGTGAIVSLFIRRIHLPKAPDSFGQGLGLGVRLTPAQTLRIEYSQVEVQASVNNYVICTLANSALPDTDPHYCTGGASSVGLGGKPATMRSTSIKYDYAFNLPYGLSPFIGLGLSRSFTKFQVYTATSVLYDGAIYETDRFDYAEAFFGLRVHVLGSLSLEGSLGILRPVGSTAGIHLVAALFTSEPMTIGLLYKL